MEEGLRRKIIYNLPVPVHIKYYQIGNDYLLFHELHHYLFLASRAVSSSKYGEQREFCRDLHIVAFCHG